MPASGFSLFHTEIGCCGVAWSERGIVAVSLPEEREGDVRVRLLQRNPQAPESQPPRDVATAIDGMVALLAGEARDLSGVVLDMDGVPAFDRRVYEVARKIPPGATLTYGEIAARLRESGAARAVGQALGRNPFPIIVPCHRVLAANGGTGGFSARGGIAAKMRMLSIEKARIGADPALFDDLPLAGPPRRRG